VCAIELEDLGTEINHVANQGRFLGRLVDNDQSLCMGRGYRLTQEIVPVAREGGIIEVIWDVMLEVTGVV